VIVASNVKADSSHMKAPKDQAVWARAQAKDCLCSRFCVKRVVLNLWSTGPCG